MKLNKYMFREYDLRGQFNKNELNPEVAAVLGKAYGTFLAKRKINNAVVAVDCKTVSQKLKQPFIEGLLSTGCNVTDIGMVLTPIFYFSQYCLGIKGGAMISGSHNPGKWTGFKFANGFSKTLLEKEMKELYRISVSGKFDKKEVGFLSRKTDLIREYTKDVIGRIKIKKWMKVVVNAGNGTAGPIVPDILRKAGCKVVEQNCNIDDSFPNYNPDPSLAKMMESTGEFVKKHNADIGLAFDGDGDRLGVADETGKTIWPDRYLILLARQMLKKKPKSRIVFDVKCSQALEEDIKAHGGIPVMWKTGHSYIKEKMHRENSPLAGEMSGHIFYKEGYYGFDDATFAALKLLEYISSQQNALSELIKTTPYYISTPTIHVPCHDDKKYGVIKKITAEFRKEGFKVNDINGARVSFGDGWGLVRASSNLPVLVMRFEAKTEKRLKEIEAVFKKKLSRFKSVNKKWKIGG